MAPRRRREEISRLWENEQEESADFALFYFAGVAGNDFWITQMGPKVNTTSKDRRSRSDLRNP